MHYVQKITTCFKDDSQEYQRIRIKIIDVITSRLLLIFPEISGKFPETLNFRNPSLGLTAAAQTGAAAPES